MFVLDSSSRQHETRKDDAHQQDQLVQARAMCHCIIEESEAKYRCHVIYEVILEFEFSERLLW